MRSVRIWRPAYILSVLSGDVHLLWDAFSWGDTPQGHVYWRDRAGRQVPLSDEDRDYLQRLYASAVRHRLGAGS